ncbi:cardiolipin synthase [Methanolinea mesophila]|uniref:cardiolipin synthase n=1 Tax=Methanolinea mesophila TaxID=547055 RepID=UPI001AE9A21D|nr:cardiolipin synthase [Methanolinea mesophila]MBP1927464.1 cardiolipin synthase [Methanolinea mesophila]
MDEYLVALLVIGIILNGIAAVSIVFLERKSPTSALAWLIVLVFLPLAGFILYLIFGQNIHRERMFRIKERDDLFLSKVIAGQQEELRSEELRIPGDYGGRFRGLAMMLLQSTLSFFTMDNRVEIFTTGEEKFAALFREIEAARDHIHLEYYILRNDGLGRKLTDLLTEKCGQGLEVRLLLDGLGSGGLPRHFFDRYLAAGGKLAYFFPSIAPLINPRMNYRNHRKIVVIDGNTGFVGGFNVGEEYLGKNPRLGAWRDTHVMIRGSAAMALQLRFILDWSYASKEYLGSGPRYFPGSTGEQGALLQIVSGGPDARWSLIEDAYLKIIASAREKIYIQSPYFVPDESVLDSLRIASRSGVDVRVMIPRKRDHPFVHWASYSFLGDLLDSGVKAYIYEGGFIHAKSIVVDGLVSSVGSANWDIRSFRLNFETNAFIYDREISGRLEKIFFGDLEHCTLVTPGLYAARSVRVKIKESVSRLFSPLL